MWPETVGDERQRRAIDLLVSFLGLTVLSPLMATIAVLIKLESKGPILFKQARLGEKGKSFAILKFRSMEQRPDQQSFSLPDSDLASYKFQAQGQKTVVGRALRACSMDELPNLLNVLRGDLHIVGPRPDEPELVAGYEPDWHSRHNVKPGITGLAQIKGRTDLTYREAMAYDLRYVAKRSLRLDAAIMLRTLNVVVSRRGAR